jgi:hypothetical protein
VRLRLRPGQVLHCLLGGGGRFLLPLDCVRTPPPPRAPLRLRCCRPSPRPRPELTHCSPHPLSPLPGMSGSPLWGAEPNSASNCTVADKNAAFRKFLVSCCQGGGRPAAWAALPRRPALLALLAPAALHSLPHPGLYDLTSTFCPPPPSSAGLQAARHGQRQRLGQARRGQRVGLGGPGQPQLRRQGAHHLPRGVRRRAAAG